MATEVSSSCMNDPNFAVLCAFYSKYYELLGLDELAFTDLQQWLEDTNRGTLNFTVLMM